MAWPPANPAALRPDCSQCFALCCTAFGFARSADFAVDKPPATPCSNLAADFSCTIHDRLRVRGFAGCTVFDCFGAGQRLSQVTSELQDSVMKTRMQPVGTVWGKLPRLGRDLGRVLGRLVFDGAWRFPPIAASSQGFVALGTTMAAYGLTELLHR